MAAVSERVDPREHFLMIFFFGHRDDCLQDFPHMFRHVELIYRGGTESAGKDAEICYGFGHVFRQICRDLPIRYTPISAFTGVGGSNDFDIELVAELEHLVSVHRYFDGDGCSANQGGEVARADART